MLTLSHTSRVSIEGASAQCAPTCECVSSGRLSLRVAFEYDACSMRVACEYFILLARIMRAHDRVCQLALGQYCTHVHVGMGNKLSHPKLVTSTTLSVLRKK